MAPPKKIRRDNHPSTSQKASKSNTRSEDDSDDDFVPGSHTPPGPSSTKTQPKRKSKKPSGPKGKKNDKENNKVDENGNKSEINQMVANFVPQNIFSVLQNLQHGGRARQSQGLEHCARSLMKNRLQEFQVYKSVTPFNRRVTAMAWHPKRPNLCAVGSKGGEIIIWNFEKDEFEGIAEGIGPGGSIQKIMFDPNHHTRVYTCSIDGTMELKNLNKNGLAKTENFLNFRDDDNLTHNWDKWYTSFDIAPDGMTLVTGDNSGYCTLLTYDGEVIWRDKLHKNKVTNIEFSHREPWLFVTTSTDNSVKIWDIRMLTDDSSEEKIKSRPRKNRFLQSLEHKKAVNSAYFSHVDGTRLLTTDQHSELRIYKGPFWDLERVLPHPHRQFQHLTPIKATWHPLVDLVVAGRYPDPNFPGFIEGERRSIDIMNPDNGAMECQIVQDGYNKISSLNLFSPTGNAMISGMGQTICIWKQKPVEEVKYEEKPTNMTDIVVEEWPGFKPQKAKKNPTKKSKKIA